VLCACNARSRVGLVYRRVKRVSPSAMLHSGVASPFGNPRAENDRYELLCPGPCVAVHRYNNPASGSHAQNNVQGRSHVSTEGLAHHNITDAAS